MLAISTPCRLPIASIRASISAPGRVGTQTSSVSTGRRAAPAPGRPGGGRRTAPRPRPGRSSAPPRWRRPPRSTASMASASLLAGRARRVDPGQQQGGRVVRQPHVLPVVDGAAGSAGRAARAPTGRRRRAVTAATAVTGGDQGVEEADDRALRVPGAGRSRTVISVIDAERALGADHQPGQVVAGDALGGPAARAGPRSPCRETTSSAQHVVAGHAVLDAAQAAGVGGDVAADGRPRRAGGVGRVPQAVLGGGRAQVVVDDARLHDGEPLGRVDLAGSRSSARELMTTAAVDRVRPAGQTRSRRRGARAAPGGRAHDRTTACDLGGAAAAGRRRAGSRTAPTPPRRGCSPRVTPGR